jgi:hypothetical protein
LDDVLIFEKILQGPERYRIGKPCKVRSATESGIVHHHMGMLEGTLYPE